MASARFQCLLVAAAIGLEGPGCDSPSPPAPAPSPAPAPAPAPPRIEWTIAPDGDVAEVVQREAERAQKDGRTLLVYVGASWCEPCRTFHEAAEKGEIAADLPLLRMLEFDLDRDAERLSAAGYGSKMIPLFAAPGADGRGSGARMEGSVKGPGAVPNIVPRLRALLTRAKGS
jgi:thiol-disulfide isomerase/thioredoxin